MKQVFDPKASFNFEFASFSSLLWQPLLSYAQFVSKTHLKPRLATFQVFLLLYILFIKWCIYYNQCNYYVKLHL